MIQGASSSRSTPDGLVVLPVPDGQRVVVIVSGEADAATATRLRDQFVGSLIYRPRALVVDATGLTFCDLRGLDALSEAVTVDVRSGVTVTIRPSPQLAWLAATVERVAPSSGPALPGVTRPSAPRPGHDESLMRQV